MVEEKETGRETKNGDRKNRTKQRQKVKGFGKAPYREKGIANRI